MLGSLGLDEAEEMAYRRLVTVPTSSARELAADLGVTPLRAATIAATLEGKGLVARSTGEADRFVASPPALALGALMAERHEELRRAQLELEELNAHYRRAVVGSGNDIIEVVRGAESVGQRFLQLQRTAQHTVQNLVMSEFVAVAPEDNPDEEIALARGVHYQVVVERGLLERPGFYADASDSIALGVEVRIAPQLPLRLLLVDRELALVPLSSATQGNDGVGALLIHRSGLLDALLTVFDYVWERAAPLRLHAGDGVDEAGESLSEFDTQILSLLLAGLTDDAIGGQLDVSLRTVQRRVRVLMDRVGVATRIQLGYQVRDRNWMA